MLLHLYKRKAIYLFILFFLWTIPLIVWSAQAPFGGIGSPSNLATTVFLIPGGLLFTIPVIPDIILSKTDLGLNLILLVILYPVLNALGWTLYIVGICKAIEGIVEWRKKVNAAKEASTINQVNTQ